VKPRWSTLQPLPCRVGVEQQVKDLPLNGRSFDNLITLNPGTANTTSNRSATSTGGGQGNNFSISGNREDLQSVPAERHRVHRRVYGGCDPRGVSGQLLGVDAVREFNVLQNTYGAEYGKRPGGQISLVTCPEAIAFMAGCSVRAQQRCDARNSSITAPCRPLSENAVALPLEDPSAGQERSFFGSYEASAKGWR